MTSKARALVITPLGERILRAVAAGTYKFSTQSKLPRVGVMLKRGKMVSIRKST